MTPRLWNRARPVACPNTDHMHEAVMMRGGTRGRCAVCVDLRYYCTMLAGFAQSSISVSCIL